VVFLAIYLDRLTSALAKPRRRRVKTRKLETAVVTTITTDEPALASS
jgi:glycine betaine/proline transport system permease protein